MPETQDAQLIKELPMIPFRGKMKEQLSNMLKLLDCLRINKGEDGNTVIPDAIYTWAKQLLTHLAEICPQFFTPQYFELEDDGLHITWFAEGIVCSIYEKKIDSLFFIEANNYKDGNTSEYDCTKFDSQSEPVKKMSAYVKLADIMLF